MAKGLESMPIHIDVIPDLSRFRQATVEEIVETAGCDNEVAAKLIEHFCVIPR